MLTCFGNDHPVYLRLFLNRCIEFSTANLWHSYFCDIAALSLDSFKPYIIGLKCFRKRFKLHFVLFQLCPCEPVQIFYKTHSFKVHVIVVVVDFSLIRSQLFSFLITKYPKCHNSTSIFLPQRAVHTKTKNA